jgi:putative MATE family efflux protein
LKHIASNSGDGNYRQDHSSIPPPSLVNMKVPLVIALALCSSQVKALTPMHHLGVPMIHRFPHQRSVILTTSSRSAAKLDGADGDELEENVAILKRSLSKEFLAIGIPALVQLAAEPLASLVDTAYLGRLGPEVLGGAGVAISAQYAVSKLYNDPLLRTSISLVASQDGKSRGSDDNEEDTKKGLSIAVSSALLLAFSVGMIQLIVYTLLSSGIIRGMGLDSLSPMWQSAVSYLRVRALGTPAATLWLVTNGIFRGLGDTRTPLVYSLIFTLLNVVLDPLFIFTLNFGASGAAAGTAIAQYAALVPLLMALNRKVQIDVFGQIKELGNALKKYLEAGSFVLVRTLGKVLAYAVCARQAALLGSVGAAAYNLTFQLGFATTQICEAVAVAVQTLLA